MKIAVVSLGCPKNQVDADVFCHALLKSGHTTVPAMEQADAIIVNTCGFLDSAKEEAIEYILDACALKKRRPDVKVVVTGCLAERYRDEVASEIPEVDAVVGIGKNTELPLILERLFSGPLANEGVCQYYGPKTDLPFSKNRVIGTPLHYAYLKIAEGCSNACSYCAIPQIRGPMRSRPLQDCVEEAEWLADQGVRELILVAQDVTAYGEDEGENRIGALLDALNGVEGIRWIRILYAYPERVSDAFVDAMVRNDKVLPYLDLPIQHCNDEILRSMRRRGNRETILGAVKKLRDAMSGITLRTSLIAGYPGESEEQFEELCAFVREVRFERLGCFAYSPEEGTKAARMPNQLPDEVREKRAGILMEMQGRILLEEQEKQIGRTLTVLCDGLDAEENRWLCRSAADAPEIDTVVLVDGTESLEPGGFYNVEITGCEDVDVAGEFVTNAL